MTGEKRATGLAPLAAGMGVIALVMALAPLAAGGLYLTQHEGDTMHLADLVLRMAEAGQLPHFDFMTPIGILALWPIALFAKLGLGFGHAILAAQALMAAALFVPILRAAQSRFPGGLAWAFALYVLALCLALVHGEATAATSVSMHYNRWAWAMAYVAVPLALLEPLGGRRPLLDGVLIGLMMAGMVLIKVTYFAAFAPAVVVALIARRDGATLLWALITGLAVAAAVTGLLGVDFWQAYLHDLLTVATSESRAAPGDSFGGILGAPKYVTGTMLVVAGVIFLRQAGAMVEGLGLLVLMPAFFYVTYQNFGNDPQWLVLLALLVLTLRPGSGIANGFGWRLRDALLVVGVGALALGSGSAINLIWSPFRAAFPDTENTVALLGARPKDGDVLVQGPRIFKVTETVAGDGPGSPFAAFAAKGKSRKPTESAVLNGETLPDCEIATGFGTFFETLAADLEGAGYGGSGVLIADIFSALWLYGPFKPVEGAAPWYYAGTPGLENADHVLVPLCPNSQERRVDILKAITAAGWTLVEERRTPTYVLLRPVKG